MQRVVLLATLTVVIGGSVRAEAATSPAVAEYRDRIDKAVERGLAWLAANQRANGTFNGRYGDKTAIVALAGMAFLSKGYTPGLPPYGENIDRCVDFLVARPAPEGPGGYEASNYMYTQGMTALFLSEVSGMVDSARQQKVDLVLAEKLGIILAAQRVPKRRGQEGGWRYSPTSSDSDLSVSSWCFLALRSARINGAPVPKKAIDDAVSYVRRSYNGGSGGFGYMGPGQVAPGTTGAGILIMELAGHHGSNMSMKAGDFLLKVRRPDGAFNTHPWSVTYATYYTAHGFWQLGEKRWEDFARVHFRRVLAMQRREGFWGDMFGEVYGTSMHILSLTVIYGQLPIYQR